MRPSPSHQQHAIRGETLGRAAQDCFIGGGVDWCAMFPVPNLRCPHSPADTTTPGTSAPSAASRGRPAPRAGRRPHTVASKIAGVAKALEIGEHCPVKIVTKYDQRGAGYCALPQLRGTIIFSLWAWHVQSVAAASRERRRGKMS